MTAKQKRFVTEYLIDLNATQAALRAGYKDKAAYSQGQRLLKNVEVQKALQDAIKRREKRTEVTADRIVKELEKIGFSDLKDFVEFGSGTVKIKKADEVDGTALAEIQETVTMQGINRKIKLHDKIKALDLLGQHLGMWNKKIEIGFSLADIVKKLESDGK